MRPTESHWRKVQWQRWRDQLESRHFLIETKEIGKQRVIGWKMEVPS